MSLNDKLLQGAAAAGGITPSEHFGVVTYEGNSSASHSINGGKFGGAASFNGSNGKIDLGVLNLGGAAERTISAWVFVDSLSSAITIYQHGAASNGQRFGFAIDTAGKVYVEYYNRDAITSAAHISVNTWYHLAAVYNGGVIETATNTQIYVNGSAVAMSSTGTQTGAANTSNTNYGIGYRRDSTSQYFNGKIDQLRIFSKALSSSEISTLYAETAATVESLSPLGNETVDTLQVLGDTSCVATYQFENNEDDLSGNYDGTGYEVQYAAGRYGQAASFDGSNSYVSGNVAHGDDFSVSAWVYPESHGYQMFYQARQDSANLIQVGQDTTGGNGTISISNKVSNTWNNFYTTSEPLATLNQWYHIAVNFTSSDAKIYVNGSFVESHNVYSSTPNYSTFNIGATNTTSYSGFWNGKIDQVRLFNKALSASEVTTLYEENSLIASYRFEGNSNDDKRYRNGSDSNIEYEFGLNFKPDFVWIKDRGNTEQHILNDSTRGATKDLSPNTTAAEATRSTGFISFDTGGFTLGTDGGGVVNDSSRGPYVAWCLKANGGTTSSNSDGDITSTVQVNSDAGFSIVKWASSNYSQTIGHGLDSQPDFIMAKELDTSRDWFVWHSELGNNFYLHLNTNDVYKDPNAGRLEVSGSDKFICGTDGTDQIAYVFKNVDGFSNFGSYRGTGSSTDTPIIETGFEPAFVMIKVVNGNTGNWNIYDNKRNLTNPRTKYLIANGTNAENSSSADNVNFLSNGFQLGPTTDANLNVSNNLYIYAAFAADPDTESPTLAKSFSTVTYTGNGSTQSIDGLGFSPDFVWLKSRSNGGITHTLFDTLRGAGNELVSAANSAQSYGSNRLTSFDTDGFSLGDSGGQNMNNETFVAWSWKADDDEPTIIGGLAKAVYKMEDNANDVTGNFNGTANNLTYATGKFNKAAVFNGSTGDIDLPAAIDVSNMAVSLWLYLDDNAPTNQIVIEFENGYGLNFPSVASGKLAAQYANSNSSHVLSNSTLSSGQWYHIAASWKSGTAPDLWIDNVKQSGGTVTDYLTADENTIGSRRSGEFLDGMIDQVRIYHGPISSFQVNELYAETTSQNDDLTIGETPQTIISANANAGFSIVKYEGDGQANHKIQHGLSSAPEFVMIKNLNDAEDWQVFGNTVFDRLQLNSTGADDENFPLSYSATTITLPQDGQEANNAWNASGDQYIMYSWHSVSGYSAFGYWQGGTTTVTIGFRADFVLYQDFGAGGAWNLVDSVRGDDVKLLANTSDAESSQSLLTITDTGFTVTSESAIVKRLYMAFKIN